MTYSNDYNDAYATSGDNDRAIAPDSVNPLVQQALDWGISGSILAVLILTALYTFSPVDFIPDVIPLAGQADDVAAILAGGGSVTFLTLIRYLLRTRVGRRGCLLVIVLGTISAFIIFGILTYLINRVI